MSAAVSTTPLRFDHVVLGVRDLAQTTDALIAAGLVHAGGGEHTGRGTANSLFPLATGYLELLTVTDPDLARSHSPNRAQVAEALCAHAALPLGFAFQVQDVTAAGAELRAGGQRVKGPVAMSRRNPDGTELTWRNLYVGATQWRTLLPFLITWDAPHELGSPTAPQLTSLELAPPGDLTGSPSGGWEVATGTYHLLGATHMGTGHLRLADIDLLDTGQPPAGGEGLIRIHLEGGIRRAPIGAGLDEYLTWTDRAAAGAQHDP